MQAHLEHKKNNITYLLQNNTRYNNCETQLDNLKSVQDVDIYL